VRDDPGRARQFRHLHHEPADPGNRAAERDHPLLIHHTFTSMSPDGNSASSSRQTGAAAPQLYMHERRWQSAYLPSGRSAIGLPDHGWQGPSYPRPVWSPRVISWPSQTSLVEPVLYRRVGCTARRAPATEAILMEGAGLVAEWPRGSVYFRESTFQVRGPSLVLSIFRTQTNSVCKRKPTRQTRLGRRLLQ